MDELDSRGVNYRVIVPSDGSVYADQTLMMNKFDTAHADFNKMFMEWVLTDEAQAKFSKYGARPIRTVSGENKLTIPADARVHFLPDEDYAPVVEVDWQQVSSEDIATMWENQVVGGG
jgi:ABC-type Fe3+ transport system substrate-binding protein